jgi:hypothetical protein
MHNCRFGQAYCIDLFKRIPKKFTLYIYDIYYILYEFVKFNGISWNNQMNKEFGNLKTVNRV